jgi:uncharacterized membrane protein YkoI
MTQKTALILAAVLTAFVLVVGGAVAARVSQPAAPAEAAPAASAPTAPAPTAAIDVNAQVEQLLQQREAQYRQLIDQANQRLAAMNQQLAAAQAATARTSAPAATTARAVQSAQPSIALSAEAARNIAITAANFATMIREPELVRFEGKVAYEVGFTRGVVYVDANTGAVLYNGTQQGGSGGQPATQPPAPSGEHEHDHESDGHDD